MLPDFTGILVRPRMPLLEEIAIAFASNKKHWRTSGHTLFPSTLSAIWQEVPGHIPARPLVLAWCTGLRGRSLVFLSARQFGATLCSLGHPAVIRFPLVPHCPPLLSADTESQCHVTEASASVSSGYASCNNVSGRVTWGALDCSL